MPHISLRDKTQGSSDPKMQSAFAGPSTQQYDSKQYFHWSATYIGTGAAAEGSAAAAAAALQQQLAQQGFPSTGGSMQHPETPAAQTAHENLNQLWQAATNGRDSISPYDSLEPEQEDEEEEPSPPKQRKTKGKKSPGSRGGDKAAKAELRMIKNRESAARSRLKRQQHTTQLEQENAQLRSQVAALTAQVHSLNNQVEELTFQLSRAPQNTNTLQRTSATVSHNQQQASALPPAPSLSLSLPNASSLMLPPGMHLDHLVEGGLLPQEGLAIVDGFGTRGLDFYTSRRGSSYA